MRRTLAQLNTTTGFLPALMVQASIAGGIPTRSAVSGQRGDEASP